MASRAYKGGFFDLVAQQDLQIDALLLGAGNKGACEVKLSVCGDGSGQGKERLPQHWGARGGGRVESCKSTQVPLSPPLVLRAGETVVMHVHVHTATEGERSHPSALGRTHRTLVPSQLPPHPYPRFSPA